MTRIVKVKLDLSEARKGEAFIDAPVFSEILGVEEDEHGYFALVLSNDDIGDITTHAIMAVIDIDKALPEKTISKFLGTLPPRHDSWCTDNIYFFEVQVS